MTTRSLNRLVRPPLLMLAATEALILYASVYFAALLLYNGDLAQATEALGPLVPQAATFAIAILLGLLAVGLYQLHQRIVYREVVIRVIVGLAIGTIALSAVVYVVPAVRLSGLLLGVAVSASTLLILIVRFFFIQNVDKNVFRRRTLILGSGARAASIADLRRRADRRGFRIVGHVVVPGAATGSFQGDLQNDDRPLSERAMECGAEEIVIAMDDRRGNLPIRELLDCRLRGIEVIDLIEFLERETGKIRIDLVSPGWLIFSGGFRKTKGRLITKRIMDITVSASILVATLPLIVLIALAIKLDDGWHSPVLYKQRRVGLNGSSFFLLKFRSMIVDAESDGKAVWAAKNDSRITRVGRHIRNLRLDELPQLLNVLRGQMSIVGPRPERPAFVEKLSESIPYYSERHTVKPGVTGWAQLRYSYGASEEDAAEKLQYDLYYVKNHTLLLDLAIILQTAEVVLWSKGAR